MPGHNKDSNVQRQIDENLRRVYDDVAKSEVPERFADLLKQLKENDTRREDGS